MRCPQIDRALDCGRIKVHLHIITPSRVPCSVIWHRNTFEAARPKGAMKGVAISVVGILSLGVLACGEVGLLAVSAGAPVTGVVEGAVTECGAPVPEAEV